MTNRQVRFDLDAHPRFGLALGSGSARGLAHFGVIRAIEEAGIKVDFIAGTSIGALVGAVYAAGKVDALETTFKELDWRRTLSLFDVVLPKSGLLDGAKLSELVHQHIHAKEIEALPKLFRAIATDMLSGEEVVIRTGDIIEAVRASSSVPGIFTPVRSNGRLLVDCGLVNPVPVSAVRAMGADIIIAVDVNHHMVAGNNVVPTRMPDDTAGAADKVTSMFSRWVGDYANSMTDIKQRLLARGAPASAQFTRWVAPEEALPSIFDVLLASINIMEARITQSQLRSSRPEIIIQPPLAHIRFLEFARAEEIISIGYESARRQLAERLPDLFRTPSKARQLRRRTAGAIAAENSSMAGLP